LLGMVPLVVALKLIVAEPAGTVTVDAGTGSNGLLLERLIEAPPAGAVWLTETVQVVLAPEVRLVGLQDNEDSVVVVTKLMVAVCETPLREAVRVAL